MTKYIRALVIWASQIIRLHSHKNGVAVNLLPVFGKHLKLAYSKSGQMVLLSEFAGWTWYNSRHKYAHQSQPGLFVFGQSLGALQTRHIEGLKIDYRSNLTKTYPFVEKALDHYFATWPARSEGIGATHGDLTLDNIIFGPSSPTFIDWENFSARQTFWGYDALYLALSSYHLPSRIGSENLSTDLDALRRLMVRLSAEGVAFEVLRRPFFSIKEAILTNPRLRSVWAVRPSKFIHGTLSDSEIGDLDSRILSR